MPHFAEFEHESWEAIEALEFDDPYDPRRYFEQIDDLLRFTLVGQQSCKPCARNITGCLVSRVREQLIEHINSILVAILVHVQARHRKPGLRGVRAVPVLTVEPARGCLRRLQVAVGHVLRDLVVQDRRRDRVLDLLRLVVIDAEQDERAERDATNDLPAVVRPPRPHFLNLFFFRK